MVINNKAQYQAPLIKRLMHSAPRRISHSDHVHYVAESLGFLFNARQGMVASAPDYGLPDFNEFTHVPLQTLKILERSIVKAIEAYEPRLTMVKVTGSMDEDWQQRMRFSISGVLVVGTEQYRVNYQSVMTPGGRVIVKT